MEAMAKEVLEKEVLEKEVLGHCNAHLLYRTIPTHCSKCHQGRHRFLQNLRRRYQTTLEEK